MKMTPAELATMERRPYTLLFNKLVETECIRDVVPQEEDAAVGGDEPTYRRPMFTERKRITDALLPVVDQLVDDAVAASLAVRRDQIKDLVEKLAPSGPMREDHYDDANRDLIEALSNLLVPAKAPSGQYAIVAQGPKDQVSGSIGPYASREIAERELPKLSVLNGGKLTIVPIAPAP